MIYLGKMWLDLIPTLLYESEIANPQETLEDMK